MYYEDICNFLAEEVFWFEPRFDDRLCSFWTILPIFRYKYLDNQNRLSTFERVFRKAYKIIYQ